MQNITLRVNPETLVQKVDQILALLGNMEKEFDQMDGCVKRSVNYWDGGGGSAHRNAYAEFTDDILAAENMVKSSAAVLRQMAEGYLSEDQKGSEISSGLPVDVIM